MKSESFMQSRRAIHIYDYFKYLDYIKYLHKIKLSELPLDIKRIDIESGLYNIFFIIKYHERLK